MTAPGRTFCAVLLGCACWLSTGAPAASEILLAIPAPISGPYAHSAAEIWAGAELAAADINAAGGVLGEQLKLVLEDDACNSATAQRLATEITTRKPAAVIGHPCSSAAIAAAQIYARSDTLLIAVGVSHPRLTDARAGPTIFRLAAREDRQGESAGRFIVAEYGEARVAILHDRTMLARTLAHAVHMALKANGKPETMIEGFHAGDKDYSILIESLRQKEAAIVYVAAYPTEAAIILRQMRDAGFDVRYAGSDILAGPDFLSIAGKTADGMLATILPAANAFPAAAALVPRLEARGVDVSLLALSAYAALEAWSAAVRSAGSFDAAKVASAFSSQAAETVLGPLTFDARGDASKPAYQVHEFNNGTWVPR